jgi:hypothetical protein
METKKNKKKKVLSEIEQKLADGLLFAPYHEG